MTDKVQKFDVMARRSHLTETRIPFPDDPKLTLPVTESIIVQVTASFDALSAETDDQLFALVSEQLPLSDGWGPWQLCAVRDAYEFPEPPPLSFAPTSPAGMTLALSLAQYPSLYGADAFGPYNVLEHWFCVIGNGYDWAEDGWLREWNINDITPATVAEAQRQAGTPEAQAKFKERQRHRTDSFAQISHTGVPVPLYPLSESHSALFTLPENIEDSFLVAAFQLAQYLLARPVWENCSYPASDLSGLGREVYKTDLWRQVLLAEGMRQRTVVDSAYSRMVLHPVLGPRLHALGCEGKGFGPLNYCLPPRFRAIESTARRATDVPSNAAAASKALPQVGQVIAGLQILQKYDDWVYCEHDMLYAGGGDSPVVSEADRQELERFGWRAGEHGWERSV